MGKKRRNDGVYINNESGQVNYSAGKSTIHAKYVVEKKTDKVEELEQKLRDLVEELKQETKLAQELRTELEFTAKALIEDIESKQLPKNRMGKLHRLLERAMPEMQLTATAAGVCSAITDVLG